VKVLVIGKGGREHAMAWKLAQGPSVSKVFVAPGNPGMEADQKIECVGIGETDFEALSKFFIDHDISYAVVGAEVPLDRGIVDFFLSKKLPIIGPTKLSTKLESSKIYSKQTMLAAEIPTAEALFFDHLKDIVQYIGTSEFDPKGWVLKADELEAGKGVFVVDTKKELLNACEYLFNKQGRRVLLEKRLVGPEVSYFALCDGEEFTILGNACDYKRLLDHGKGPNTGGMGSYSPADWVTKGDEKTIIEKGFKALLKYLAGKGTPFHGFLFLGAMITKTGPYILEYNVRMGDPETQSLMPRIKTDLATLFLEYTQKSPSWTTTPIEYHPGHGVHVVLASAGYPGIDGEIIKGVNVSFDPVINQWEENRSKYFAAGVGLNSRGEMVSTGGRVMGLTSLSHNKSEAARLVYQNIGKVQFEGAQYRNDIAQN